MICYPVSGGITFEWKGKHSLKNKYGYEDPYDVYSVRLAFSSYYKYKNWRKTESLLINWRYEVKGIC